MTPITRRLHEVYANLWGPHKPASISGKSYVALLLNEFTRKLWVLMLRIKDEFFDVFKLYLPKAKAGGSRLDCLQIDSEGEFISVTLQSFCQERGIKIGYAASYMYEENDIAERCWRMLVQIKDLLLIDSRLPNKFWAEAMDITNYRQNQLPITDKAIIPEETWTRTRQNFKHIRIFGSKISTNIPSEKRFKSDVHKT